MRVVQAMHYAFDESAIPGGMILRPRSEVAVEFEAVSSTKTQLPKCSQEHQVLAYRLHLEAAEEAMLPVYIAEDHGEGFDQD